ncbi:unnamed protein product, partial [marine sediment metagenome]
TLSELEASPSMELVAEIENEALGLSEDVLEAARKARGTERTLLSGINVRVLAALGEIPLIRNSVARYLASVTPTERERNMAALRAAIRVIREDLTPLPVEGGE